MTHNEIMAMLAESQIPVAYDHYAEGESPDPPFLCFRYPATDHFSADGRAYYLIAQVDVEVYTDRKTRNWKSASRMFSMRTTFSMRNLRSG